MCSMLALYSVSLCNCHGGFVRRKTFATLLIPLSFQLQTFIAKYAERATKHRLIEVGPANYMIEASAFASKARPEETVSCMHSHRAYHMRSCTTAFRTSR